MLRFLHSKTSVFFVFSVVSKFTGRRPANA